MDAKKIEQIRGKLQRHVEALIRAGGFLNSGGTIGVTTTSDIGKREINERAGRLGCCILGAVVANKESGPDGYHADAAQILGITFGEACEIEQGYMGSPRVSALRALGAELREMYYGGEAQS